VARATRIEIASNILILKMIDYSEMPSYFWLVSARLKKPVQDKVRYMTQALRQDLLRLREAWEESQRRRDRDAIYIYLTAAFNLVAWWVADNCAVARAQKALRLHNLRPSDHDEPFAAVIRCTSDLAKVDKRTRSKWSRVLRYALQYKDHSEPLVQFIRRKGGINECASRFARLMGVLRGTRFKKLNLVK
jgi:hypothetical protein